MEIIQDDAKKLVQVWLTRQEGEDSAVQERLQPMYAQWKQQEYMVAVFHSGQEDLKENTLALLAYNKRRSAELAVQREKKQRAALLGRGRSNLGGEEKFPPFLFGLPLQSSKRSCTILSKQSTSRKDINDIRKERR